MLWWCNNGARTSSLDSLDKPQITTENHSCTRWMLKAITGCCSLSDQRYLSQVKMIIRIIAVWFSHHNGASKSYWAAICPQTMLCLLSITLLCPIIPNCYFLSHCVPTGPGVSLTTGSLTASFAKLVEWQHQSRVVCLVFIFQPESQYKPVRPSAKWRDWPAANNLLYHSEILASQPALRCIWAMLTLR